MEDVVGPQRRIATVCISRDDDVEQLRNELLQCIEDVDDGDGAIVLTDMFGGTAANLAISSMFRGGVDVVAGMNLPMLVKLAKVRSRQSLEECVDTAETAGRKYIAAASRVLEIRSNISSLDPRWLKRSSVPLPGDAGYDGPVRSLRGLRRGPKDRVPIIQVFGNINIIRGDSVAGDKIVISDNVNSVISVKSRVDKVTQHIGEASGLGTINKDELTGLIKELQLVLEDAQGKNPGSADVLTDALETTVDRVARNPPNPRSIKLSVDALAEAADDISGAVPVVTKIATAIANMFGFSVD